MVILVFMDIRYATPTEASEWDARILANPDSGNVFQGDEFAEQKKLGGWKPRYIVAGDVAITALEKSVFGLGKLWYMPKGPGVKTVVQLGDLLPTLHDFATKNGVFALKIEPELEKTVHSMEAFEAFGLVPVPPIQPNFSTVLIDLSPGVDEIMSSFNKKGRHAIHRAERDGVSVEVKETTDENCQIFYDLLAQTAGAQGFKNSIRPYDYYHRFWQRYTASGLGQLFFAYVDGKVVAGAFGMIFGDKSTYKDGASVREKTAYGASHLLQWHVMLWAKEQGSKQHNLLGTPPSDRIHDETHPWYGVGRFKTSFNKHVTDYVGAFDLVIKPNQYKLWTKYGERIVKKLWWRKHHESWY
jgi:lipid II:glycine glycyltransferase (peptidoglycan interpeptide bridge formation enzyme)